MFSVLGWTLMLCLVLRFLYVFLTLWNATHRVGEFEPVRIRDFMVTSSTGEQQVRRFYEWLDSANAVETVVKSDSGGSSQECAQHTGDAQLLRTLYRQKHMWAQVHKPQPSAIVLQWMNLLHALYVTHVAHELSTALSSDMTHRCAHLTRMFCELIEYSNVYTHPNFPLMQHSPAFLQGVVRLALSCSANVGFLPGFLLFAHLCPEFVTEDCYPYLNNETHVYQHVVDMWDVEQFSPLYADLIYKYESFVSL